MSAQKSHCLDASALPPFKPTKKIVHCANGPMPAVMWAFSSCVPPMARMVFAQSGGASNASLKMNTTPAMQWNYSMLHMAHHYEERFRNFIVTNEEDTVAILLQVTSLRACPDDVKDMNVFPRSAFVDPQDDAKRSLGALPIFFVRYFHEEKGKDPSWKPSKEAHQFIQNSAKVGGLMKINAASIEEINFAHEQLQRGQALLGKAIKTGKFNESVLFPTQINKTKSPGKAPYVCAACDTIISARPAPSCSKCKMTYYCNRECQVSHWKSHKKMCRKAPTERVTKTGSRKSFVFDIEDAKPPSEYMTLSNNKTGNVNVTGLNKDQRSELKKKGQKVYKAPNPKNVHGDKEFIVKLQPPAGFGLPTGPWMCYDGPTRSFQAYIPSETTGLPEVHELLQREGVESFQPMLGVSGYKGYFNAKWEGSSVRVFYDQIVSPQLW